MSTFLTWLDFREVSLSKTLSSCLLSSSLLVFLCPACRSLTVLPRHLLDLSQLSEYIIYPSICLSILPPLSPSWLALGGGVEWWV